MSLRGQRDHPEIGRQPRHMEGTAQVLNSPTTKSSHWTGDAKRSSTLFLFLRTFSNLLILCLTSEGIFHYVLLDLCHTLLASTTILFQVFSFIFCQKKNTKF